MLEYEFERVDCTGSGGYSFLGGHTFTTRMCEAGVNIKVIQDALGHSDISTTLNIYADVTKEMKAAEFKGLDSYFIV